MMALPIMVKTNIFSLKMQQNQPETTEIMNKIQKAQKEGRVQEMKKFQKQQGELYRKYELSSKNL